MRLEAAQGWVELGDNSEAVRELGQITPQYRSHPDVLELKWKISALDRSWNTCLGIAETLAELAPRRVTSWLLLAASLNHLGETEEACETLIEMLSEFPENPALPYQLACYSCELGDLNEAIGWWDEACQLGDAKELKALALQDTALMPLWDCIRNGPTSK